MINRIGFLISLFLLLQFNFKGIFGFSFDVPARGEECFYETFTPGTSINVMFQVTKGGFLDIDVAIKADGRNIYQQQRQTEGKYTFIVSSQGTHSFCFGNTMSTLTPKTVSLSIKKDDESPSGQSFAKQHDLTPLEASILQLSEAIRTVDQEQDYIKMRERVHRNTSESTNSRVVWWSVFEVILLLSMSLLQIFYLRKIFEIKRVI